MRLVHAYVAELLIEDIKDDDALLEHLHSNIWKNQGHSFGPALVEGRRRAQTV